MNVENHKSLVNSSRKRTQRSFALENDTLSDMSQGMSRRQKKWNRKLAQERFAHLGSLSDLVHSTPKNSVERSIALSIRLDYDNMPKPLASPYRLFNSQIAETSASVLGISQETMKLQYGKTSITFGDDTKGIVQQNCRIEPRP